MSSSFLLHRMLVVFLLFCLSKASGGTCLSYGHSCWGGHGKRSGGVHMIGPSSQKHTSGWYISKFLDSPAEDSKNIEEILTDQNLESEVDNFSRSSFKLYPRSGTKKSNVRREKGNTETNSEQNKSPKWDSETDGPEEEIIVLSPAVQREPVSKFRLYQIMNQENDKPRREF